MTQITSSPSAEEQGLFDVTILSPRELKAVHRGEGHVYAYKVIGADGSRSLTEPVIVAGDHAHDPLAYRHAALLRVRTAAIGAQMIDEEHRVVSLASRRDPRNV